MLHQRTSSSGEWEIESGPISVGPGLGREQHSRLNYEKIFILTRQSHNISRDISLNNDDEDSRPTRPRGHRNECRRAHPCELWWTHVWEDSVHQVPCTLVRWVIINPASDNGGPRDTLYHALQSSAPWPKHLSTLKNLYRSVYLLLTKFIGTRLLIFITLLGHCKKMKPDWDKLISGK